MANKAELILESDETEGTPFQGSGKNHILISPTEDNSWESGSVKVKILNPHDAGTARWRTVYMWDPTNTIHLPDPDDGAILDVIELVFGMYYKVVVETAGVESSFWRYQQDG